MSQQVKITRARVHGSAVYLGDVTGPDGTEAPVWSANPDEVLGWLCDGFRFRFNQRRSTRCRYLTCEDRNGDRVMVIDQAGEPVLVPIGRTVTDITDAASPARAQFSGRFAVTGVGSDAENRSDGLVLGGQTPQDQQGSGPAGGGDARFPP
jgi:putative transposase